MRDIWQNIIKQNSVYIIAEAGVNHNGSTEMALDLIEAAARAGADCIKFQTFKAERVATADAMKLKYQLDTTDQKETHVEMLKKLELPQEAYGDLIKRSEEVGIDLLSTPYNFADVDLLNTFGFPAFKISSSQIVEIPFLRYVASTMKPIILSTGMATLQEIKNAVKTLREAGNDKLVLLQCTTNYPSRIEDANVMVLSMMEKEFGVVTGYSDHTLGNICSIVATTVGAKVIEKHFTLDKTLPGPDQSASADPIEMKSFVSAIRDVHIALGDGVKEPTIAELANSKGMRRSISARLDITSGIIISEDMLDFSRPATGLSPEMWDVVVGSKAVRDIKRGTLIRETDFKQ